MIRAGLAIALVVVLSGCLVQTPDEAQQPAADSTGTSPEAPEGVVLGRVHLHNDGTRQWMSSQPGDALPLPGLTATTQGATYTFPYEPTLSETVATAGFAQVSLATSTTFSITGETPVYTATLLIDDLPVGSASARGSGDIAAIPLPATIPAGSALALQICFCGTLTDLSGVVFEPDASFLDVLGPLAGASCGETALDPGAPSVQSQGSQWVASRTDKGSWPAPARHQALSLSTHNGNLFVERSGSGDDVLETVLEARGATSDEALARLAALCIVITRSADGTSLGAKLVATDNLPQLWNNRGASMELQVPAAESDEVRLDASNGAISVTGLRAATLLADSSNGGLTLHADVQDLTAESSNGGLDLEGAFGNVEASTSNGGISFMGKPWGDGAWAWVLDTSNGPIDARVTTGSDLGYDVEGSTSNAAVTLDLVDSQAVGSQRETSKHVRTNGYEQRGQRVAFTLDTSNGSIDLQS